MYYLSVPRTSTKQICQASSRFTFVGELRRHILTGLTPTGYSPSAVWALLSTRLAVLLTVYTEQTLGGAIYSPEHTVKQEACLLSWTLETWREALAPCIEAPTSRTNVLLLSRRFQPFGIACLLHDDWLLLRLSQICNRFLGEHGALRLPVFSLTK
jgi:hypothetical protein